MSSRLRHLFVVSAVSICVLSPITVLCASSAQAATPTCTTDDLVLYSKVGSQELVVRLPTTSQLSTDCTDATNGYESPTLDVQAALVVCYGKKISIDGAFGPATKSALEAVQKSLGVSADGVYGPQTGKKLKWDIEYGAVSSDPGQSYGCRTDASAF